MYFFVSTGFESSTPKRMAVFIFCSPITELICISICNWMQAESEKTMIHFDYMFGRSLIAVLYQRFSVIREYLFWLLSIEFKMVRDLIGTAKPITQIAINEQ